MIVIISPAKTLDFESPLSTKKSSEPRFLGDSKTLIKELRQLSTVEISQLMKLSDKLSELNHHRYRQWQPTHRDNNARQALFAFKGDVYVGLQAETFKAGDINFAQQHLRILSGLYGLLRPLDQIQPYRLEMGTKLKNPKGKTLYEFWGKKITHQMGEDISASKANAVINLASNEYSKVLDFKSVNVPVISPVFKDSSKGELKIISFFAKKARGLMSAYIIKNRLRDPAAILEFADDGYRYQPGLSTPNQPVFTR